MSPPLGIIISISIITALSVAVLENPQVQAWLEQQRQKIVELLRSFGEELDPQSRRAAEAFAYEGRTPATDEGLMREKTGSYEAAAVATGRSLSSASTIRRIPVRGPTDPDEAEERRRRGREYLARRNQQMFELQQRREKAKADGTSTPPTPTSFDAMVDDDGKLRLVDNEKELPSPPAIEPVPEHVQAEMREVERHLGQPLLAESSASSSGWHFGSQLANPFGDEYALDRSETPKPPVPPKEPLEVVDDPPVSSLPGSFTPRRVHFEEPGEELSYEEQLAIALSLSEAESSERSSREYDEDGEDADLRAAIEASLKEANDRQAGQSRAVSPPQPSSENPHPLVDLSPPSPTLRPRQPVPRGKWETMFDQAYAPTHEPFSLVQTSNEPDEDDELYRVTPDLTRARLATFDAQQATATSSSQNSTMPYDPVREAAGQSPEPQQALLEASFYSAASSAPSPATTHTMDHEATPRLIDVTDDTTPAGAPTPASRSSFGFQTDTESDSDTFASASAPASRAQSRPRSEVSNIEVVDVIDDSDVDMLSEEGDGIATPDSWTEVGSRDGESEAEDESPRRQIPVL